MKILKLKAHLKLKDLAREYWMTVMRYKICFENIFNLCLSMDYKKF